MAKKSMLRDNEIVASEKPSNVLAMPSAFASAIPATLEVSGGRSAFVVFAHSMSAKLWPKIQAKYPLVKEGETYYINGPEVIKLAPFEFFLIVAKQYFVEEDQKGAPEYASLHGDRSRERMYEQIESVLIVKLNDGTVRPARHTFKGAKCNAVKTACETNLIASQPEWATLSPLHQATLAIPQSNLRYITTVSTSFDISKAKGRKFLNAQGTVRPTSKEEYDTLVEFFTDPTSAQLCEDMIADYNERVEMVMGLMDNQE